MSHLVSAGLCSLCCLSGSMILECSLHLFCRVQFDTGLLYACSWISWDIASWLVVTFIVFHQLFGSHFCCSLFCHAINTPVAHHSSTTPCSKWTHSALCLSTQVMPNQQPVTKFSHCVTAVVYHQMNLLSILSLHWFLSMPCLSLARYSLSLQIAHCFIHLQWAHMPNCTIRIAPVPPLTRQQLALMKLSSSVEFCANAHEGSSIFKFRWMISCYCLASKG